MSIATIKTFQQSLKKNNLKFKMCNKKCGKITDQIRSFDQVFDFSISAIKQM